MTVPPNEVATNDALALGGVGSVRRIRSNTLTVTPDTGRGDITIESAIVPVAGVHVEDEGTPVVTGDTVNFVGAGVTATDVAGVATITIPGGGGTTSVHVEDEGTPVVTGDTINFKGAGVTATDVAGVATITIPGPSAGGGITVLDSTTTLVTVVNTTEDDPLYTHALPTDAKAGDVFRLHASGDLLNNRGSGTSYTFRLKLGAATVLATAAIGLSSLTARASWDLTADVAVVNPANSEKLSAVFVLSLQTVQTWAAGSDKVVSPLTGVQAATQDITFAKNLVFSVQMSVANSLADCRLQHATLERLNAP